MFSHTETPSNEEQLVLTVIAQNHPPEIWVGLVNKIVVMLDSNADFDLGFPVLEKFSGFINKLLSEVTEEGTHFWTTLVLIRILSHAIRKTSQTGLLQNTTIAKNLEMALHTPHVKLRRNIRNICGILTQKKEILPPEIMDIIAKDLLIEELHDKTSKMLYDMVENDQPLSGSCIENLAAVMMKPETPVNRKINCFNVLLMSTLDHNPVISPEILKGMISAYLQLEIRKHLDLCGYDFEYIVNSCYKEGDFIADLSLFNDFIAFLRYHLGSNNIAERVVSARALVNLDKIPASSLIIDYVQTTLADEDTLSFVKALHKLSTSIDFYIDFHTFERLDDILEDSTDRNLNRKCLEILLASIKNRNDTLPEYLFNTLTDLIKQEDPELSARCVDLLFYHLQNMSGFKTLPGRVLSALTLKFEQPETQRKARQILKDILGETYQPKPPPVKKLTAAKSPEPVALGNLSLEDKNLDQLLQELAQLNAHSPDILAIISGFRTIIENIARTEKADSSFKPSGKSIALWENQDCAAWANKVKASTDIACNPAFLPELIAVVKRASKIHSTHEPRLTQVLSLLILLASKGKGRLAEIKTGEGKSTIVAMFAAIKNLQNRTVDVVSSSPVLASRDAEEKKGFFQILGISVGDNNSDHYGVNHQGYKDCYGADIVYGDAHNFQADLLNDEYMREHTRGERAYNTIIVDEVDSMLIDGCSNIVMLSGAKPGMEYLKILYIALWQELLRINQAISLENNCLMWKIPGAAPVQIEDRAEFTIDILKKYLTTLIQEENLIYLPKHLKTYALEQAEAWSRSAFSACFYTHLEKDYVITQDEAHQDIIAPVDYANTGTINANSVWGDGLHQFLQIKHLLKIYPESLTTSFNSNLAYFKRYDNIFGLTGTLGGHDAQKLLEDIYQVDSCFIPTYRPKRFVELPGILAENEESWLAAIVTSVLEEAGKGRAVLLVCETIAAARVIENAINKHLPGKTKCYSRTDTNENMAIVNGIDAGEVISATNLAARGTDIKTSKAVESRGGLHVCATFLAPNLRVELQTLGRTSRQGNLGTGQLIINKMEALAGLENKGEDCATIESIKAWRDHCEASRLEQIRSVELDKIIAKDELFNRFCQFVQSLRDIDNNKRKIAEVEERWGFWFNGAVRTIDEQTPFDKPAIFSALESFLGQLLTDFKAHNIQNVCHLIQNGNDLTHGFTQEIHDKLMAMPAGIPLDVKAETPDYSRVIQEYSMAINADATYGVQAYYQRAYVHILAQSHNYKQLACNDLHAAREQIEHHVIPQLQSTLIILNLSEVDGISNTCPLVKQIHSKINLLKMQMQNIDSLIQGIQSSERDVKVTRHTELMRLFSSLECPEDEIRELHHTGLNCFFEVSEVPKENGDLFGILCVVMLGVVQIVAGTLLTISGNVYSGAALIAEGVSDLMHVARKCIDGNFSWNEYRANKIASLAITVITLGINTIRQTAAIGAPRPTLTRQQLISVAKKQVKDAVISSAIKETVNLGMDTLTKSAIDNFRGEIADKVRETLVSALSEPAVRETIHTLLSADKHNQTTDCLDELLNVARQLIHSQANGLNNIAASIISGVIARQSPGLDAVITLAQMARTLDHIMHMTSRFSKDFIRKIFFIADRLSGETIALQETEAQKENLFNNLVNMITESILAHIHGGIVKPVSHRVINSHIDDFTNKIQQVNKQVQTETTSKLAVIMQKEERKGVPVLKAVQNPEPINIQQNHRVFTNYHTVDPFHQNPDPHANNDFFKFRPNFFFTENIHRGEKELFYRGDARHSRQIFEEGFSARGKDMNLIRHTLPFLSNSHYDSAYISTSKSLESALLFPYETNPSQPRYLYEILPVNTAIDIQATLAPEVRRKKISYQDFKEIIVAEKEMAIPHKIPSKQIKGVWEVSLNQITSSRELNRESYIINPNYGPEKLWRMEKNIGKAMTALALANDGQRLYSSYQLSQEMGDYDPLFRESAKIAGGWAGAIAAGSATATQAASLCAPLGPYVIPVCAFTGGVIGSIAGYHAGEESAAFLYQQGKNADRQSRLWDLRRSGPIYGFSFFNQHFGDIHKNRNTDEKQPKSP